MEGLIVPLHERGCSAYIGAGNVQRGPYDVVAGMAGSGFPLLPEAPMSRCGVEALSRLLSKSAVWRGDVRIPSMAL